MNFKTTTSESGSASHFFRDIRIPRTSAKVDRLLYELRAADPTEKISLLERIVDKHPHRKDARMAYAEALIMTHDIAEAGRQARCAVSLKHEEDPNWLARAASTIVRSDLDLAIAEQYIQQAHIRAEASELEFGLLYVAHNVDGFIAFQRGEFAKAEERFAKADDSEPGFSEYPFLVAQLFIDHGLAEEARDMLIQESAKYSSPEFGKVRSRFRRSIEGLPRAATNRPKRHDGWMKVAELVLSKSPPSHIRCPVNDDGELVIEWLPHGNNERGKCHLLCPTCGAQLNVVITGS